MSNQTLPDDTIEVLFSHAMDCASVESAFQITPAVKGTIVTPHGNATSSVALGVEGSLLLTARTIGHGQIELDWPVSSIGFVLEAADALGKAALWTPVADMVEMDGDHRKVAVTTTGETGYFRLHRP